MSTRRPRAVTRIDLLQSTVYAVTDRRTVLVDAGPAGHETRLLNKLARAGIHTRDVAAIVLTHCHPDHAGGAAFLQRYLGVPVGTHVAETGWARTGSSDFFDVVRPFGHLLRRTMAPTFPPFVPDLTLDTGASMSELGADLTVVHTPGHTPGSITLLHQPTGDALVGDLLSGGLLQDNRPNRPFFAENTEQLRHSVRRVLDHRPRRLLFGHGRPASATSVANYLHRL
ncbi:MBL fold metallo-hydrolase [Nocardia sp. CNY236]|uniref:MBL fold metallo-hydrolase n=1 Tax=Nocardia sp. CNY236 TaxID=1169152 RepID=UPI0003F558BB|nr:MBL fold metallo-hydrolase [Nocardia sp. CNY236]